RGDVDAVRLCIERLETRERAALRHLVAVATWASGDEPAARHALRMLGRGSADRALVAIASLELASRGSPPPHPPAQSIRAESLRNAALRAIVASELARGVVRRDLVRVALASAEPLEAALTSCELAVLQSDLALAAAHLSRVGKLLASCSRPVPPVLDDVAS